MVRHKLAPKVFFELGADIIALGVEPDGFNINRDCGLWPSIPQEP